MQGKRDPSETRIEASLWALALGTLLLVGLVLQAASGRAAETPGPSGPVQGTPAAASAAFLGKDQELLHRAEGRIQRIALDRLLGVGKAEVALEEAADPLPGTTPSGVIPVKATVVLEEEFVAERLDLVRSEILESLHGYPVTVVRVEFRFRNDVLQAIQDAQDAIYYGAYDVALKRTMAAIQKEPTNVTALELLGSVYYLLGDKQKAKSAWERVLKQDPDNQIVPLFLKRLG
jgi:tetratricopeptide (TPR) repeat protein